MERRAAFGRGPQPWQRRARSTPAPYSGAVMPGLAFGGLLGVLYAALYALLQLEDVALLSGSILLSLAMWFTRNLHRSQLA